VDALAFKYIILVSSSWSGRILPGNITQADRQRYSRPLITAQFDALVYCLESENIAKAVNCGPKYEIYPKPDGMSQATIP
jgi:hypothetical protein